MKGNFFYKRVGERIVTERKRKGFSQERLAFISDIDRTYLARLEAGKANPSLKVIGKISKKLRISISNLLEGV